MDQHMQNKKCVTVADRYREYNKLCGKCVWTFSPYESGSQTCPFHVFSCTHYTVQYTFLYGRSTADVNNTQLLLISKLVTF